MKYIVFGPEMTRLAHICAAVAESAWPLHVLTRKRSQDSCWDSGLGAFLAAMGFGFCLTMALAVMMFRQKQVELLGLAETDPLTGFE